MAAIEAHAASSRETGSSTTSTIGTMDWMPQSQAQPFLAHGRSLSRSVMERSFLRRTATGAGLSKSTVLARQRLLLEGGRNAHGDSWFVAVAPCSYRLWRRGPVILPAALRSVHEMSPQSRADLFWLFCASRAWRVSTAAGAIVAAPRDSGLFSLLKMALIPLCIAPSAFASPHILGAVRLGLYPVITPSRRPRMKASLPLFPLISPRPTPPLLLAASFLAWKWSLGRSV